MINNISWTSYGYVILIMAIVYYLLVILIYYKRELNEIVSEKAKLNRDIYSAKLSETNKFSSTNAQSKANPFLPEDRDKFNSIGLNALQDEFSAYFIQSSDTSADKDEIISDLIQIVRKYPQAATGDSQDALKKLVLWACEKNCAVTLSEDDIERVWKG